ncbi:potassium-transporting ATPase subunit KdpC [Streptomyces sp. NPDC087212]|uniref:potassium-transporting ATPase subunit KdpC n=1 Tax=Streptomyces sp. NPDC087212 TaxID=3365766 RepID=UPI003806826A
MANSLPHTARLLAASLRALIVLTLLTGVAYPLVVTGIAQTAFRTQANGSPLRSDGKVVGSSLIGQQHYGLAYFQPRPANGLGTNTVNTQYRLLLSGATNLAADNKVLIQQVEAAKSRVVKVNSVPGYTVRPSQVPADAVTSSGSGLDPDISPQYADLQIHRVAARNHLPVPEIRRLVAAHTEGRTLGFLGEPRVNVLELNVAVKELAAKS